MRLPQGTSHRFQLPHYCVQTPTRSRTASKPPTQVLPDNTRFRTGRFPDSRFPLVCLSLSPDCHPARRKVPTVDRPTRFNRRLLLSSFPVLNHRRQSLPQPILRRSGTGPAQSPVIPWIRASTAGAGLCMPMYCGFLLQLPANPRHSTRSGTAFEPSATCRTKSQVFPSFIRTASDWLPGSGTLPRSVLLFRQEPPLAAGPAK